MGGIRFLLTIRNVRELHSNSNSKGLPCLDLYFNVSIIQAYDQTDINDIDLLHMYQRAFSYHNVTMLYSHHIC